MTTPSLQEHDTAVIIAPARPRRALHAGRVLAGVLPPIVVFVLVLAFWQLYIRAAHVPPYLLPAPGDVVSELGNSGSSLLGEVRYTLYEAIGGFLLGSGLAFLSAVVFTQSKVVERGILPWAIVLQTVPIIAIAPLLTIWFGNGLTPKIIIAGLICFFPVLVNSTRGLRSVDPKALELMQLLHASRWHVLWHLRIPSSLPFVFSALRVSSTLSVVGAIVAEFTGSDYGIGNQILQAGLQDQTALLFAAILCSSAASILFYLVILLAERLVLRWPGASMN